MPETSKRRHRSADEKLRVLEEAQQPGVQIAELCRRHGIGTSQFYTWREQARQAAKAALSQPTGRKGQSKTDAAVERLLTERDRLRAVVAEITAENLDLRKNG
ncbi:MAG: transposase [Candidatus Methylomirabilota bacterium]